MDIRELVEQLYRIHETRNPYKIAKQKNIIVSYENLGTVKGYYNHCYKQKFIHINADLNDYECNFVCGHELGHALLHPKTNTPFYRANTLFSIDKLEREANIFACELIYDDEVFIDFLKSGFTSKQISNSLNLSDELVRHRICKIKCLS